MDKCDCSGKAQKQLYSKLQTRFVVREDALIAKRRNCQTKAEEQDKIWSRPDTQTYWSTDCQPQEELQLQRPEL
jgi:hypothetical protein